MPVDARGAHICDLSLKLATKLATQDISARRVAAAVERQVQQLGWAAQRTLDIQEGWELTREYLQHARINVEGVVNQIRGRLDHVRGHSVFRDHSAVRFGFYFTLFSTPAL